MPSDDEYDITRQYHYRDDETVEITAYDRFSDDLATIELQRSELYEIEEGFVANDPSEPQVDVIWENYTSSNPRIPRSVLYQDVIKCLNEYIDVSIHDDTVMSWNNFSTWLQETLGEEE